jgi:hypothetical protein
MDGVLMRVMARMGDPGRNVVDRDDAVEQHDHDKEQQAQREIIEERVFHARSHRALASRGLLMRPPEESHAYAPNKVDIDQMWRPPRR